ncbi:MAG: lytic transglycosylase [Deltaproteobacteria bacterium HGW-Deltaproteobacteria-7]|jgi:soluble lytic murein transglycosylase-like protein|nr:MAG: lytic transglycosylase [Deltaproteobacteria bacterium HGW-Deltaproteobacteria-7]PKN20758.1 MAG: lytic transglycosylase [Deltaproteobacteria bacterium HGW-Deltaproteobacteria-6]
MVISRDVAALSKLLNQQGNGKTNSTPSADKSVSKFNNYLSELIGNKDNISLDSSAMTTLSKDQLILFTKALQIQMNARLYNTVFNNSLESNALASKVMQDYGARISHHRSDTSKNNQQTPKNNLSGHDPHINQIVDQAAQKFDVDADLIRSVIKTESNFNASATSPRGAMGLMQLMPETARELGVQNAYDPRENVMGGTRYLKMLLTRYDGQVDLALAAYNWGMGNVEKKPDKLPAETIGYIEKVNSYYKSAKA